MTHNDEAIKEWLGEALHGQQPKKRARDLLGDITPRRQRSLMWLPMVAAAMLFGLVVSSLTVPAVAWALAQAPLVGGTYARFVEGTGLDLAYQAGLVKELNRTVSHGDFELLIVAAYRDANQTVVVHQLTSHDPAILAEAWEASSDLMPRFVFPRGWSGSSTMKYVAEENMVYGISHIDPDAWGIFGQKLTMQIPALDLTVSFPVQSVASSMSETVSVKKTVEYRGMTVRVDEVTFSPSATRVSYTVLSEGSQSAEPAWNSLKWSLKTDSGTRLDSMSAGLRNSRDGHVNFLPTDSRQVEILLMGETVFITHDDTIALETGNTSETSLGVLDIASVVSVAGQTEVHLKWSGVGRLAKSELQLVDASGIHATVSSAEGGDDFMKFVFTHGELAQPLRLEISSLLIETNLEILVAKVQR